MKNINLRLIKKIYGIGFSYGRYLKRVSAYKPIIFKNAEIRQKKS